MYTFSLVSLSEIKLHNREIAIEATGGARTPRRLYVPPTPHTKHGGLIKGSDRAVTTCRLPLQTVGIVDIQQHLANLDTMSILVRDTLVSRGSPTLRMDRHHTRAIIRILEQLIEFQEQKTNHLQHMAIIQCKYRMITQL